MQQERNNTSVAERAGLLKRIRARILGVPLLGKLIGANVIIVAAAIAVQAFFFHLRSGTEILILFLSLAIATLVNFLLVRVALKPIDELEQLADRVSAGDFKARGTPSPFADAQLRRLGRTVNGLLDALAAERRRIQDLGAEVVHAQDTERAKVSRELHDSIAQTLAAVRFQLSAAAADADAETKNRIAAANSLVSAAMEEVKNVSYALHPRVAEDLGLEAALEMLARQVEERSGVEVRVNSEVKGRPIPGSVSATLFRVAQEAVRNIEMHSHAKTATVNVIDRDGSIVVEVSDDGRGFDPKVMETPAVKTALASVKDRVTLAGGVFRIDSVPNGGTRVTAKLDTMKAAS
jgi:two-component system sensor histidine kinase UhpB